MIYGAISDSYQHRLLCTNKIWKQAFEWLGDLSSDSPCGTEERYDGNFKLSIDSYRTKAFKDCRFESHREFIDIQFCQSGGELIHWTNYLNLELDGHYKASRDVQFYKTPEVRKEVVLPMELGTYAIFYPEDAHCPQVTNMQNKYSKKVVLKIHRNLLES
jgi:YhcH/YjgK/YiaL family protein